MNGGEGNGGRSSEDITLTATGITLLGVLLLANWIIGARGDRDPRRRER